jgi:hypothetical protein
MIQCIIFEYARHYEKWVNEQAQPWELINLTTIGTNFVLTFKYID